MIRILLFLALVVASYLVEAQSGPKARNTVYFELGGSGGAYSFKFDRTLFNSDDEVIKPVVQIGMSWIPLPQKESAILFPFRVMQLLGNGPFKVEIGIDLTYGLFRVTAPKKETHQVLFPALGLGVRKLRQAKAFTWRAGASLGFNAFWQEPDKPLYSENQIVIWPGVAIGYGF